MKKKMLTVLGYWAVLSFGAEAGRLLVSPGVASFAYGQREVRQFLHGVLGMPHGNFPGGLGAAVNKKLGELPPGEGREAARMIRESAHARLKTSILGKGLALRLRHPKGIFPGQLLPSLSLTKVPDEREMAALGRELGDSGTPEQLRSMARHFFNAPSRKDPLLVKKLILMGDQTTLYYLAKYALPRPHWTDQPELVMLLIEGGTTKALLEVVRLLSLEFWIQPGRELVDFLAVAAGDPKIRVAIIGTLFPSRPWKDNQELLALFEKDESPIVRRKARNYRAEFSSGGD